MSVELWSQKEIWQYCQWFHFIISWVYLRNLSLLYSQIFSFITILLTRLLCKIFWPFLHRFLLSTSIASHVPSYLFLPYFIFKCNNFRFCSAMSCFLPSSSLVTINLLVLQCTFPFPKNMNMHKMSYLCTSLCYSKYNLKCYKDLFFQMRIISMSFD